MDSLRAQFGPLLFALLPFRREVFGNWKLMPRLFGIEVFVGFLKIDLFVAFNHQFVQNNDIRVG